MTQPSKFLWKPRDTPRSIQDRQSDESVSDGESSTMSIMGASEVSGEDEFRDVDDEPAMAERVFPGLGMRVGFLAQDDVNVEDLFRRRACVPQPSWLKPLVALAQCGRLWSVVSFAIVRPRSVMPRGGWKHQFWTVGQIVAQVGQVAQSWPACSASQAIPSQCQLGTSHFFNPPVALPTEFPQKPPKRCIVWKQPSPRWETEIHLRSLWWRPFELLVPRPKSFLWRIKSLRARISSIEQGKE